ncbi:MAG: hypothetical protein JXR73_20955, partial [Candidatus Omnitrophica bacterium]|nr:hypothetical protein [Candidatus Omnitrophota bacterium]
GDILPGETAPFTKEDDASVTVNCYELTVEKTADPEKTVFHDWDIEKTVSPEGPIYLNLEEETSYTWTITVTKISSEDMDWSVSGTITVENPAPIPVTITNIADELPGAQNLTFTPPDLPQSGDDTTWVEIAAGASQQWTYSADFLNGDSRSNSITVSILGSNETYQATVEFEFDESSITKEINESVVLTDDNELEGLLIEEVISTSPWTNNYPRIHECTVPGLEQKINTAVIALKDKEENDITKDSTAELDINCGPEVTINVEAIVTPKSTYQYAITKDVDPDHWDLFYGDQGVSNYTITVEQTYNPTSSSFIEFEFFGENDSVYAMKVYADTANSTLTPTDSGETLTFPCDADNPIDVLIGESWNCVATADNLIPGTEYTVDADFIVELYDPEIGITEEGYIGELTVEVSKSATATEVTNPSYVNVDDYFCVELPIEPGAILPPYDKTFFFDPSDSGTPFEYSQDPDDPGPEDIVVTTGIVSYPRDFDCFDNGGCDNIAYIRETGQSDDASVTVDCYEIVVTKDAAPDSEKKYDWSVTKSADASSLTLKPGQAYLLGYTVTLNKGVDEYYDLTGNITVDNPAPIDAVINSLADILDPAPVGGVTVDFGVSFPYVLPAGGQLNGTYSASWESEPEPGTNIATATRQNFKYESGEDPVPIGTTDISSDPPTNFAFNTPVYYEKYDLYDTMHDLLGSLWFISYLSGPIPDESGSYPETPKEFNYLIQIGPFTEEDCGLEYRIPNIAQLWSIDVGEPPYADPIELYAEAPWTVVVQLDCGCTLTQGYWKTHTKYNSPPRDDTWDELSEGEDTTFFLSGQSYYDVMWFKHQGNAYYILARQYIAATLNSLAGASVPAEVQEALGDATTFFETYVPSYFDKANLKGKEGKEVRDIANDAKSLAGLLDQYNNGLIGPGHCSEDYTSNNSD